MEIKTEDVSVYVFWYANNFLFFIFSHFLFIYTQFILLVYVYCARVCICVGFLFFNHHFIGHETRKNCIPFMTSNPKVWYFVYRIHYKNILTKKEKATPTETTTTTTTRCSCLIACLMNEVNSNLSLGPTGKARVRVHVDCRKSNNFNLFRAKS